MEKVLVTGAGGVLGLAVIEALRFEGYKVVSIDGRSTCDLEVASEAIRFFVKERPDYVIHLAAAVYGVGGNLSFPADIFRRNTLINTNVIEACRASHVKKIVAMGTVAMYSDDAQLPFKEEEALLGSPHSSERFYAFSKRGMLMQLEAYKKQYSLEYAMLLSTNLYGPGDRFDEKFGHVVPSLICKFVNGLLKNEDIEIWGDGSPVRDFLYSSDAAAGVVMVMRSGAGLFNLASGQTVKIRQLVDILCHLLPGSRVKWDLSMPMGQINRSYCISRIKELGFRPRMTLDDGIKRTLEWYQANSRTARGYLDTAGLISVPKGSAN